MKPFFRIHQCRSLFLVSALCLLVLGGCAGTGRLRYDSAQEAYKKGVANFEDEDYSRAAKYFQSVFDYGRANEWSADAQFYLGRSYYKNEKFILSASEFTRFIQLYRSDERASQAEYMRAMSYYKQSPDYQLDQTKTRQALDYFQLFLDRYPQSDKRKKAESHITALREKLAHKKYSAAEMYARRERYEAAALTYEGVFDQYPDTKWADDALMGVIKSYLAYSKMSVQRKKEERLQPAISHYEQLVQLYPDSPLLKKAEKLYDRAQSRISKLASNEM